MESYEVWSEGFACTGNRAGAQFVGVADAETFKEAVIKVLTKEGWDMERYFDEDRLTYWACRFFDNEIDARKSFG